MLNIALADLQLVFTPCQLNHWIQRPEKPQKQIGLTLLLQTGQNPVIISDH